MITTKFFLKSSSTFIYTAGLLTLLLTSCAKTSPPLGNINPVAAVSIIQASPDELPLDVFIDNAKVNQVPVTFGQSSNYFPVSAGKNLVNFYTDAAMKNVLTDTINFVQNATYSLFLVNTVSQPAVFLLKDTLSTPTGGNASIRFINLSPDAPAVDLVIKGGATLVSNKSFKGYSFFAPIPANTGYTFEVHQAGTGTVLATLTNVNLGTGLLYTIWLHGLAAGTTSTDKLSAGIINNTYFL